MKETVKPVKRPAVVVLHDRTCPSTPKTVELVKECVSELGLDVDFRTVLVTTQEEAEASRFLGSPTVQVDGADIDPTARDRKVFGFF